ncbi:MAG: hypothetical protein JJU41_10810 [Bacteroidetes bacterium]|nr:hypothetical protein [Bacteroidota bacterium]
MLIIIITIVLALLLQLILPWWSAPLVAFLVAASFKQKPLYAFINGFTAIFLLWFVVASGIYLFNSGILGDRLAALFSLPYGYLTVVVTALIGGLAAGSAALSGNLLRTAIANPSEVLEEQSEQVNLNPDL